MRRIIVRWDRSNNICFTLLYLRVKNEFCKVSTFHKSGKDKSEQWKNKFEQVSRVERKQAILSICKSW